MPAREARAVDLHLQLDRYALKACEALYLVLTAAEFPEGKTPSIQVRHNDDAPVDVRGVWTPSLSRDGNRIIHKLTTLLLFQDAGVKPRFLFYEPGEYRILVKVGPDLTTLRVTASAGDADDVKALGLVGSSLIPTLFWDDPNHDPDPKLVEACTRVSRLHAATNTANYCRAYLAVTAFKNAYNEHKKAGGRAVYGDIARNLEKTLAPVRDSYFGELVGFYTCFSYGLSGQFPDLLRTAKSVTSHATKYAEDIDTMRSEVETHYRPNPEQGK